ncbi:MAG: glycosyltransferase family 4 protein [bacterium]
MRIAYITGKYPSPSETFIEREIVGMRKHSHEIEVFSIVEEKGQLPLALASGMIARRWSEQFKQKSFDLIVAHFGNFTSTIAMRAAGNIPLIISLHARDIYVEADQLELKAEKAKHIVTCTQENKVYLDQLLPVYKEKISLIYHGLPNKWFTQNQPSRESAGILKLLAVGRFVEKKGFQLLPTVMKILAEKDCTISLKIIGNGPMLAKLQSDFKGIPDVIISPWMDENELIEEYYYADIFLCPSVITPDNDRDGLPNVVIEAMACGLPIIGSNMSGIPEAVTDGVNGYLTTPNSPEEIANAIMKLSNNTKREAMSENSIAIAHEKFSADKWYSKLNEIFHAAINS